MSLNRDRDSKTTAVAGNMSVSSKGTPILATMAIEIVTQLAKLTKLAQGSDKHKTLLAGVLSYLPTDPSNPLSTDNLDKLLLENIQQEIPLVVYKLTSQRNEWGDFESLRQDLATLSANLRNYISRTSPVAAIAAQVAALSSDASSHDDKENHASSSTSKDEKTSPTASDENGNALSVSAEIRKRARLNSSSDTAELLRAKKRAKTSADTGSATMNDDDVKLDQTRTIKKYVDPLSIEELKLLLKSKNLLPSISDRKLEDSNTIENITSRTIDVGLFKQYDVLAKISELAGLNTTARLLLTCKNATRLFQKQVSKARENRKITANFKQLLQHIGHGQQDGAEELLEGYGLRLMTPYEQEEDKLYFTRTADGCLQYALKRSDGERFTDRVITQEELNNAIKKTVQKDQKDQKLMIPNNLTAANLKLLRPYVLAITAERGHTIPQKNRCLLMLSDTTQTHAEDTIENVNPLELAYGEDDYDMFMMMLPYLDKLSEGNKKEILAQLEKRFSVPESKAERYDFTSLVTAIINSNNSRFTEEPMTAKPMLETFRKDFKPRVVTKGRYTAQLIQALADAMEIYSNNFKKWRDFDICDTFWIKVIGYLTRRLPACYGQAVCQGIRNIDHEPLARNFGSAMTCPLYLHCYWGFETTVFSDADYQMLITVARGKMPNYDGLISGEGEPDYPNEIRIPGFNKLDDPVSAETVQRCFSEINALFKAYVMKKQGALKAAVESRQSTDKEEPAHASVTLRRKS